ncbi:1-aminocyclopropane-1-carboxylate deaminase/D-cysteine desulfhydrase [Biformimicrobium ophioploci]|uniref:Pyridoxal-phosphate dependent enzyme n=1 Tax=Biformimicrobium ophioploci TaxID=3036711 RepID=A0ABQ6M365_9GAMM|nr:pyridoxal-phosphate dependent enzyme [Microbulbifer sp. NKW57]GMG88729.1 pyridoxal-phosphate dependent enzyme [Microbulbifer sp. NKW57]
MKNFLPAGYLSDLSLEHFRSAAEAIPYQQIQHLLFVEHDISVWIRRDDLIDPVISGNKAYKLLFSLLEARASGQRKIVSCGGAWSNHLHALAAAGKRFGFGTVGIVRGERPARLSAMLQDAERWGMQLQFVSRADYRQRYKPDFAASLGYADACWAPEGGDNDLGEQGVRFLGEVIKHTSPVSFDAVYCAAGTGATARGLAAAGLPVCGVPVLKIPAEELQQGAQGLDWLEGMHCGGYGKCPRYLVEFQRDFELQAGIPMDPVYTAKLLYGVCQQIGYGSIKKGSNLLFLHSGGLQGSRGYP